MDPNFNKTELYSTSASYIDRSKDIFPTTDWLWWSKWSNGKKLAKEYSTPSNYQSFVGTPLRHFFTPGLKGSHFAGARSRCPFGETPVQSTGPQARWHRCLLLVPLLLL